MHDGVKNIGAVIEKSMLDVSGDIVAVPDGEIPVNENMKIKINAGSHIAGADFMDGLHAFDAQNDVFNSGLGCRRCALVEKICHCAAGNAPGGMEDKP